MAMQAQNTSLANGGLGGIYGKVNIDPNFRADENDVLGYWNCNFVTNATFAAGLDTKAGYESIVAYLQAQGLLYNTSVEYSYGISPYGYNTLTTWTPSVANPNNSHVWDVRECRDVSTNSTYENLTIMCFYCTMDAPCMEWILRLMDSENTLSYWVNTLHGAISDVNNTNIEGILGSMLEVVTMVGSEERIPFNKAPYLHGTLHTTQWCLEARAEIPILVFFILAITTASVVSLLTYWIVLLSRIRAAIRRHRLEDNRQRLIRHEAPRGLVSWMVEAVREHSKSALQDSKYLGTWAYAWRENRQMGVVLKSECLEMTSRRKVAGNPPNSNHG